MYAGKCINFDFHTVPHYGDESVLEEDWAWCPQQENERSINPLCTGGRIQADTLHVGGTPLFFIQRVILNTQIMKMIYYYFLWAISQEINNR